MWIDPRLQWNPQEYGGLERISVLNIAEDRPIVFTPRLYLVHSEVSTNFPHLDKEIINVFYNGSVYTSRTGLLVLSH